MDEPIDLLYALPPTCNVRFSKTKFSSVDEPLKVVLKYWEIYSCLSFWKEAENRGTLGSRMTACVNSQLRGRSLVRIDCQGTPLIATWPVDTIRLNVSFQETRSQSLLLKHLSLRDTTFIWLFFLTLFGAMNLDNGFDEPHHCTESGVISEIFLQRTLL